MNQPNILLIMTDQHRFDALGCYGNKVIETPTIDWLASMGTVFTNAYTPSPSCIPARACLMTGLSPWRTGILGMGEGQGPMGVGFEHTLPGELAKAGYHTKGIGKMHFYPQRSLNGFHDTVLDESGRVEDDGFISDYRRWFDLHKTGDYGMTDHGIHWNSWSARPYHAPEFLHPTNWTVNEGLKYLENRDPSMPFFLKLSFARPHSPYDALPYYFDLYMDKDIPGPDIGDWAGDNDVPADAFEHDAWRGKRSDEEIRRARAGYYGSINHIDHQLARIFMYLKSEGLLDEMIIIFTSDHGDMLGDHNLWRKTYAYEGSAHIPMIVKMPNSYKDSVLSQSEAPVLIQDIMPTILEVAEVNCPETVEGISMTGAILGDENKVRDYVHGEHSTCYSQDQEMQYLTDGKMKYIWFPRTGKEQLFDLQTDRSELHDLVHDADYRKQLCLWRSRMVSILEKREAGLTSGNQLICQNGKAYHASPYYQDRLDSSTYKWKIRNSL